MQQRCKIKSDIKSQKNTTHFIIDVAVSLWTDFKNMKTKSGIFKLMKDLFEKS